MAIKDYNALQASFADNISGNIGAGDMQDLVESLWQVRGALELITPITTFALTTTPVAVDFFDTVSPNNLNVTTNLGAGTIISTINGAGQFFIAFIIGIVPSANNIDVVVRFIVNGVVVRANFAVYGTGPLARPYTIAAGFPYVAPANTTFSLDIATVSGTVNIDVDWAAFGVTRIGG